MKKRWLLLLSLVLALAAVSAAAEAGDFDFRSDGRIQGYLGPGGAVTVSVTKKSRATSPTFTIPATI